MLDTNQSKGDLKKLMDHKSLEKIEVRLVFGFLWVIICFRVRKTKIRFLNQSLDFYFLEETRLWKAAKDRYL